MLNSTVMLKFSLLVRNIILETLAEAIIEELQDEYLKTPNTVSK